MPSTKEIRIRIKAIKNTAKITKAMQMVAASKMRKAQESTLKNRPYTVDAYQVFVDLVGSDVSHPLMIQNKGERRLIVVITSDKGLCGSFNAAVAKKALDYLRADQEKTDVITVGRYSENFFKRVGAKILATYTNFPVDPRTDDVRPIVKNITDAYLSNNYKEVVFCFTLFESTLKQSPTLRTVLPLGIDKGMLEQGEMSENGRVDATSQDTKAEADSVIKFEPSPKEVINYLIPRILETWIYQMFLESIASEQSARMVAMKNATDAAGDLVDDLNLTYNSIRQASITQELAEISAATNAFERNA